MLRFVHHRANPGNYSQAAAEFLRALRGHRSQRALARRLGYRANPITDWERARRFPTIDEVLRAASLLGTDVKAAFARFHPTPLMPSAPRDHDLAAWLDALRGSAPTSELAQRAGISRFALGRILRGQARPRLHHFFAIVDAATDRLPHLVATLVPIEDVPSLRRRYEAAEAARQTAYEAPWTEGVLRVLESAPYRRLRRHEEGWIATRLGISIDHEERSLEFLRRSSVIRRAHGVYRVVESSAVDTRGDRERVTHLLQHWTEVARERAPDRRAEDLFAYNVCSLSNEDRVRVRELLQSTFREIRSIVAASEPTERVALLNMQWVVLDS